jgi:leucyl aminopeptidase
MAAELDISVIAFPNSARGTLVVFCDLQLRLGAKTRKILGDRTAALFGKVAKAEGFRGKQGTSITLLAPEGSRLDRLIVIGCDAKSAERADRMRNLGGAVRAALGRAEEATVVLEATDGPFSPGEAADLAAGMRLRNYAFDLYKTKKPEDEKAGASRRVVLAADDAGPVRRALRTGLSLADGVMLTRNLVNEPPNVLHPQEFAKRAAALRKLGVQVDILRQRDLQRLKMGALLGVCQGSRREPHVVVMRWNGAGRGRGRKTAPISFIGKGVCFDSGGISIKPAQNMEDMKGDMAGAACVVGLMHVLAARKARVNVVAAIGLVENMPDGNAQRPGDIVRSMSGQTIEIINTDAEGRLVLADVLWYVKEKYAPSFMINLATLTGAIIVALGQEHAGLFSNNDELAARLTAAGQKSGEKVWRMPLGPDYDKQIDSRFADVKNSGGRLGGSITAAQFLQRFVGTTPWAHLDIAGTAMGSPKSDINQSWASGWGVQLLDRLVRDNYETR